MFNPSQPTTALTNTDAVEQSTITCVADTGVYSSFTATFLSFAATAQGDYIAFTNKAGTSYAFWFDKDANGTTPTGAAYVAATNKTKVDIVTGDTAAQVAAKVAAKTATNMTITNTSGAIVTFVSTKIGVTAATPASHNTGDTGAGTIVVSAIVGGTASNYQSKYVTADGPSNHYYAWFNIGSEGVDPAPAGKTAVPITGAAGASASTLGTALAAALDAKSDLVSASVSGVVTVTSSAVGGVTDAGAGNSGLTVSSIVQGESMASPNGATNVDSLTNNPATIA